MAPHGAICLPSRSRRSWRRTQRDGASDGAIFSLAFVTEDELLLTNAIESVMSTYEARGRNEETLVQEAAANLIIEAYNQGITDEETLVHYALRPLRRGRP